MSMIPPLDQPPPPVRVAATTRGQNEKAPTAPTEDELDQMLGVDRTLSLVAFMQSLGIDGLFPEPSKPPHDET